MASPSDIDLAEYERLRHEIDIRTQLYYGLIALALTALGAGLIIFNEFPNVTLVLALISTLLWLLWTDHTAQILKVAAYIGLHLAPRLRCSDDVGALGWESFLRQLDIGGTSASRALGNPITHSVRIRKSNDINTFIALLFGGAAPLLLVLSGSRLRNWSPETALNVTAIVLITLCWMYALRQHRVVVSMTRTIDHALLYAQRQAGTYRDDKQTPAPAGRPAPSSPEGPAAGIVSETPDSTSVTPVSDQPVDDQSDSR